MKTGFDRMRGMATAGAIGLGLLGGGSARATIHNTSTVAVTVSGTNFTAFWDFIGNDHDGICSVTTTGYTPPACGLKNGFGIGTASLYTTTTTFAGTGSYLHFFDGAMNLAVDGVVFVNPGSTVDLTGDATNGFTIQSNKKVNIKAGVDAQVQYFFAPHRPVVRALYTLTNTTNADIAASALVGGRYGSGGNTTVQATSSGDDSYTSIDRWVITSDNPTPQGDPVDTPYATLATYGSDAAVQPVIMVAPGNTGGFPEAFALRYEVTIPAMSSISIMAFSEMSPGYQAAVDGAASFTSLAAANAANLMTGVDALTTQKQIVNYTGATRTGGGGGCNLRPAGASAWQSGAWWLLAVCGSLLWLRSRGRGHRE